MDKFAGHYAHHLVKTASSAGPLLRGLFGAAAGGAGGYEISKAQGYDPLATTTSVMLNAATGAEAMNHPALLRDPKFLTMAAGKEIVPQAVTALHAGTSAMDRIGPNAPGAPTASMIPGGLTGKVVAGTGLAALGATGLAALYQMSRAYKRLGDGHAIRVSTSLRKRPGQSTDLNLGISPQAASRIPAKGKRTPGDGHEPELPGSDEND